MKMKSERKSQSSMEFAIIVSFMFLFITIYFYVSSQRMYEMQDQNDNALIQDLANHIQNEIYLASGAANGYERQFEIPRYLGGREYEIQINSYSGSDINFTEMVIRFVDVEHRTDFVLPLPINLTGEIDQSKATTVNITKRNNAVLINPTG